MAWYKVPAQTRLCVLLYYDYGVHSSLPTHSESRAQETSWQLCQILELTKSKVRDGLPSLQRTTGLQLPKCVCSQSTVFMKLSDSTSTSDSAWVLFGYSRSLYEQQHMTLEGPVLFTCHQLPELFCDTHRTGTFRALRAW